MRGEKESQSIMECLQRFDKKENPSGSTLSEEMQLFRFEVVEGLLSGLNLPPPLEQFGDVTNGGD